MAEIGSDIASFYHGRSIFITGASGFVGKVLLEKLLRSCPGIANIYILIRPKRGKDIKARVDQILNCQLFDLLRRERPASFEKIVPVEGDILHPNLGISPEDLGVLLENVSVVFHSAATVRFDDPLKISVQMNIIGTKLIIELSRKMPKLAAIVHVSTAYSNCIQKEIEEVVYPPPCDPHKFTDWIMSMDEDTINRITPALLGERPNTYTYTKAVAESLFHELASNLPAAIVRPSIVTASYKEPVKGWVDNLNGPTGVIAAIGKGLLKTIFVNDSFVCDIIPVDILVNLLVAVAWHTSQNKKGEPMKVYHCTSSRVNPVRWSAFSEALYHYMDQDPFKEVVWYPGGCLRSNRFLHSTIFVLTHQLPGRLMDLGARLVGRKPFQIQILDRIWKSSLALAYFTNNEWTFSSKNTTRLFRQLTPQDKELFNFDITHLNWIQYIQTYYDGIKKYIFMETEKTPSNVQRMYYLYRFRQLLVCVIALKMAFVLGYSFKQIWLTILDVSLQLTRLLPG